MKYTIDTLREINARFCGSHILMNYDVDKANMYVELIENTSVLHLMMVEINHINRITIQHMMNTILLKLFSLVTMATH